MRDGYKASIFTLRMSREVGTSLRKELEEFSKMEYYDIFVTAYNYPARPFIESRSLLHPTIPVKFCNKAI